MNEWKEFKKKVDENPELTEDAFNLVLTNIDKSDRITPLVKEYMKGIVMSLREECKIT
jgi:hypothetical protein